MGFNQLFNKFEIIFWIFLFKSKQRMELGLKTRKVRQEILF